MHKPQPMQLEHEGSLLKGQLFLPQTFEGKVPGIMVMHDAMGLGKFNEQRARTLSDFGYIALATDMYGGGFHSEDPDEAGNYFLHFHTHPELIRSRVGAWFDTFKSMPEVDENRIAAIGFCFGGQCVLELARSGADVKAVVSYHGLLTTLSPANPGSLNCHVSIYTGSKDPYAPRKDVEAVREEMTASGANLQLTEFTNAYHAFTNPNPPRGVDAGMKYDALCDEVSWAGALALLNHCLQ